MSLPRITLRNATPKSLRRVADIADAFTEGGLDVEAFLPVSDFILDPARCEGCACLLEAGHCYCCFPVWGYGDRWQEERHGAEFRPVFS